MDGEAKINDVHVICDFWNERALYAGPNRRPLLDGSKCAEPFRASRYNNGKITKIWTLLRHWKISEDWKIGRRFTAFCAVWSRLSQS